MTKRIERRGKRVLIAVLTSIIKTPSMTREEILAVPPRRILVIRQHNQMGDMLLAVPAFRAIKESFTDVEVTVLTARVNRDVLSNNPYVDHVLTFSRNPLRWIPLIAAMRRRRYDMAIVLHTVSFSFTSAMLGLVSGARARVGSTSRPFGNSLSDSFYHLELPLPSSGELSQMNEAEHNIYPLEAIGIHTDEITPLLVPDEESVAWAEAFLARRAKPGAVRVVVHPGAGKVQNIWPPEKFAEVTNLLANRADLNLLVVEGPRDARPVAVFCRLSRAPASVIRQRNIREVAAVMQRSHLVLCNDTGVMHVSCAAGAATLAVFGPTDPLRWAPRCPNLHVVKAANGDLAGLGSETVFEKALAVLGLPPAGQ